MREKILLLNIGLFALLLFTSCKKDDTLKNEKAQVVVQGNITLKVRAVHHWWGVPYLPVYLKKNTTSWPGTDSTKFEFKAVADQNGNCEFIHLFPGHYYLYAHGFDALFGMDVIGYHALELNSSTSPNNKLDFILTVSE